MRRHQPLPRWRCYKNAVGADFHGDRCIARSADARIDDHGNFGDAFAQDAASRGILYAEAGADWRGEGMMAEGAASISLRAAIKSSFV